MFMITEFSVLPIITGVIGLFLILLGICYKTFPGIDGLVFDSDIYTKKRISDRLIYKLLTKATGIPVIESFRDKFSDALSIRTKTREEAQFKSSVMVICILLVSILNFILLKGIGNLWYTKALEAIISFFLPYYILTLIVDLERERVNNQVPRFIDEFRGAFLKDGRIKPALLESAKNIRGSLGNIIERAVLSTDTTKSLQTLKYNVGNIWFEVFIQLLINYKTNGGELIDQLYKLNKTMVLYNNLEKKKSKRLIWYEVFAVSIAFISIPVIYWVNYQILGGTGLVTSDIKANLIVSRIIGSSIISLIIIRILRKL